MALQSFLKIFMPKNKIFFELFEKAANNVAQMGGILKEVVGEADFDNRAKLIAQLQDLEHVNDDITHNLFKELGKNFITPFDREDIHYLASSLDDVADYIYKAGKKINFYHVEPNDTGMQKFAELIKQGSEQVCIAVTELRNMKKMKKISEALVKINSIENQGDDAFDFSIETLFENEPDAKEVIKKREIYQVMELVTDKCEDVSNVIESILIKYA